MNIAFKCPECRRPLTAPEAMAGRKAKCRHCLAVILVPDPHRDRWPPGMAPPRPTQEKESPPQSEPRRTSPPGAVKAGKAPPRAVPVAPSPPRAAKPPAAPPAKPARAVPDAVPLDAKPVRAVPDAVPLDAEFPANLGAGTHVPPLDDIDELLDFEPVAPRAPEMDSTEIDLNPYRSPVSESPRASGRQQPTRIRFGDAIGTTWRIYKANLGMCVAGTLLNGVCMLIAFGLGRTVLVMMGVLMAMLGGIAGLIVAMFLLVAFAMAVPSFFLLGMLQFVLPIARGERGEIGDLFSVWPIFLRGGLVLLILLVGFFLGGILLFVAGAVVGPAAGALPVVILSIVLSAIMILCALYVSLAPMAFVDKNAGVIDSFQLSMQAAKQNALTFFLLFIAAWWGLLVVEVLTCGLAGLLTVPFRFLLYAVVYLMATGQEVGAGAHTQAATD